MGRQRGWSWMRPRSSQERLSSASALTQGTPCSKSLTQSFFLPFPFPAFPPSLSAPSWDEAVPTCLLRGAFPAAQQERKARRGGIISFISFFISSLLRVAGIDVQCICHLIVLPMKMCVHSTDTGENSTLYTLEGIQRSVTEKKMAQEQGLNATGWVSTLA